MTNKDALIKELDSVLGKKPYLTVDKLLKIGLFGSYSALNKVLKRGELTSVQVSPKRRVIPRSALLDYFKENML